MQYSDNQHSMTSNLPRLHYLLSDNTSELLPEWAYFFMQLGYQLASIPNDSYRVVAALAIPTRVFSCSLVTSGIVFARAGRSASLDAAQLQYIRNLKPNTHVHVRMDDNRKHRGVFQEVKKIQGQERIIIRTGRNEMRYFSLEEFASRITVSDRDVSLPKYQQSGHSIEAPDKFLQCCIGETLAQQHILDSSFEALLVGRKSFLDPELCDTLFICKTSNKFAGAKGCLQEILRVRQFSGANKSYRTQYISPANITPEKEIGTQIPPIVVFDGANAYIKLGHKWQSAHQVVLLDRTERQFGDAIELLNQNYTYRLEGGFKFPMSIPDGIEMTVYRDSVQ